MATLILSTACGKIGDVSQFNANGLRGILSAATTGWIGPTTVDVGTTLLTVNNDTAASCTVNSMWTGTRGCMQPPAITYSDSRWHLGFTQDFLPSVGQLKHSLFANMTSLTTGLFGALGATLGLIDSGYGLNPAFAVTSSRYVRFSKFPNGNVAAVFWVQEPTTTERTVYANIYNATTNVWGSAQRLGLAIANSTDDGTDYGLGGVSVLTPFCRPSVATAGDGSAMAFWCEDTAAQPSQIMYSRYSAGVWSAATALVGEPNLLGIDQEYAFPGTDAGFLDFSAQTLGVGDIYTGTFTVSNVAVATSAVTAVNANATTGQFNIVRDATNAIQFCESMSNMIDAMLGKQIVVGTVTTSLAQLGVSVVLNPSCLTDAATVNVTASQWTMGMFYNRTLNPVFRNTETVGTAIQNIVGGITKVNVGGLGAIAAPTAYTNLNPQDKWMRSGLVDVAGDSFGNYAVVRSVAAPYYQDSDISVAGGVGKGRMLVGHQYVAGVGFIQRANATAGVSEPSTTAVSSVPVCFNGATQIACSVRNPKIMMSDAGKGLILFYQPQPLSSSATVPTVVGTTTFNPTRLWYSTYGLATGYTTAGILDQDTFCSTTSIRNDQAVCETGSYTVGNRCQNVGEPRDALTAALIDHDVPAISSAMNASGKAIIGYHKKFLDSSTLTCVNVGAYVVVYDPVNGVGDTIQVDDLGGDAMHVQVAINATGNLAVVWESVKTTGNFVYLKTRVNGAWSAQMQMNDGQSDAVESMMPNVGYNDSGEIVVSYTYSNGTTTPNRRQFVKQYIPIVR